MYGTHEDCDRCHARSLGICRVLNREVCAQLGQMSRRKTYSPHAVIFRDGDQANQYFTVVSGIVKLVKTLADGHQHIIGLVYPSDFVGQTRNLRHTYSAEAATAAEFCVYPRQAFEAFLKTHHELERQMFEMTVRELDICRDWTLLLGRKCSYERVAGFLLMMAQRVPPATPGPEMNSVQFELPFTRAEMADYLGLTLETVSRQFSRLKNKRVIELPSSREIVIPDIELLSAVARIETCSGDIDEGQSRSIA
jgi:CRP/FNR family transcriptional regulator, anaerobic regulatory protein